MTNFATLLTQEQVERIHEASLEILENVGLLVRNEKARAIFAKHGCAVDSETHIVKFPRKVVEEFRALMPPTFTFRGRDPQYDRILPEQGPVIVTASRREQGLVVRCPACQQEHVLTQQHLGTEFTCPTPYCGLSLKLNTFVIEPVRSIL